MKIILLQKILQKRTTVQIGQNTNTKTFFSFSCFFALISCVYGNLYLETSKDKHNEGLKLLQNKRYPVKIGD